MLESLNEILKASINTFGFCLLGLLIGCIFSFVLVISSYKFNFIDTFFSGTIFFLYSSPSIILVWIVNGWISNKSVASVIFVSLTIIYPIYTHTKRGFEETPISYTYLFQIYDGENKLRILLTKLRHSLPNFFSGVQSVWPTAFLSAILADFAMGNSPSLGSYISGVLTNAQGNAQNKFHITIICVLIGLCGHLFWDSILYFLSKNFYFKISDFYYSDDNINSFNIIKNLCKYILFPLILWHVLILYFDKTLPSKSPVQVLIFIIKPENTQILLDALIDTLIHSCIGLTISFIFVYILILCASSIKFTSHFFDIFMIIFQATPIIVWLGILRMLQKPGEFDYTTILTALITSVFPAYRFIWNRLSMTPQVFKQLIDSFGGNKKNELQYVKMPIILFTLPEMISIITPKVLSGVMITEYFLTYNGLGGLMSKNRAMSIEFWWSILIVCGIISLIFCILLTKLNRFRLRHIK